VGGKIRAGKLSAGGEKGFSRPLFSPPARSSPALIFTHACMHREVHLSELYIYISGVRTSVIRSMRKVKPSEAKMAAIDVQIQ
jgi:hypothetical protein